MSTCPHGTMYGLSHMHNRLQDLRHHGAQLIKGASPTHTVATTHKMEDNEGIASNPKVKSTVQYHLRDRDGLRLMDKKFTYWSSWGLGGVECLV